MIEGVVIKALTPHKDQRGWLAEVFRADETDESIKPLMAYVSVTLPGVARGPHEHRHQTDWFAFAGPSNFKVYLWDNRAGSKTYGQREVFSAGEDEPRVVVIPPGVVHAYKNVGPVPGFAFNSPNRLYRGYGKKEDVDEVRHEDRPGSLFIID
ncbi:MAG: dTDP-4-dehydrorhamnose 3,5-epimerase family protein [Deltaproteobacteria bacterium]|nr:dTDP-4-dehydrorhamnose 3,5-epimerase family protein [Deltaproteobacteria bacterium]